MIREDTDLWLEEQLAFLRKAREETDRFVTEHHVLFAEAQKETRLLQQALGLDFSPRYSLPMILVASLSAVIAAMAGSVVGLALCRVVAARCAGTAPF